MTHTDNDATFGSVPKYIIISFLTIFGFGPQYAMNVAFMVNEPIVQNALTVGTYTMTVPSLISNLAYALCVPLGPVISRTFGVRNTYIASSMLFLLGSIVSALSPTLTVLVVGRLFQGIGAGTLYLTILPVSLMFFPNRVRHRFIIFPVGGLLSTVAVGGFLGSLSLSMDIWRWMYWLCCLPPIGCCLIGWFVLPKGEVSDQHPPIDKIGLTLLVAIGVALFVPLINLEQFGFGAIRVWPWLFVAMALMIVFVMVELNTETPLVNFRAIQSAKQIYGYVMSLSSHVALVLILSGTGGVLRDIKNVGFMSIASFYVWFLVGLFGATLLASKLYDVLGSGALGIAGSFITFFVALRWLNVTSNVPMSILDLEMALSGSCAGIVLVAGVLGTTLAGDVQHTRWRSIMLNFTRNFINAVVGPIIAWFLYRQTIVHYQNVRANITLHNPHVRLVVSELTRRFEAQGHSAAQAKALVAAFYAKQVEGSSLTSSFHTLFAVLVVVSCIMMFASFGMAMTGKGQALVYKENVSPPVN